MAKPTTLGDIIREIAQGHGEKALLDSQFTLAVFMDLAPELKKEKELLRSFLLCNGAEKIIAAKIQSEDIQEACMNSIVKELEESHWLSKDAAKYVCAEFYRGITDRKWSFAPSIIVEPFPAMDLDVYRSVTIRNTDKNAKMTVPVNVDGRTVKVTLPESLTNGQTVQFPGKGKVDLQTGKAGDLYVTINIYTNPSQKSKIGVVIAAVAAVALVIGLISSGANNSKSGSGPNMDKENLDGTHRHVWNDASCETPKTCAICGATEGSKLGHNWKDATYDAPKTCSWCGETQGNPLTPVSKSIADFSVSSTFGKVWTRSNSGYSGDAHSPADAPTCWSDWSIPGHSAGAVKDNKGNEYGFGIHVDGDKSENYYYEIRLNGKYTSFSGVCACPEKANAISSKYVYNSTYTKYFEVYGDGKLLYTSPTMRYDYAPQSFYVDVTGIQVLRIQYPATPGPNEIATLYDAILN